MSSETDNPGVTPRFVGVDLGAKDGSCVVVREGAKLIYASKPGAEIFMLADAGGALVIHPDDAPVRIHSDGRIETVSFG